MDTKCKNNEKKEKWHCDDYTSVLNKGYTRPIVEIGRGNCVRVLATEIKMLQERAVLVAETVHIYISHSLAGWHIPLHFQLTSAP